MRARNRNGSFAGSGIVMLLAALVLALSAVTLAEQIEVSASYIVAQGNEHYDRNPSPVVFGGELWLFYTKGDYDSTQGVRMSVYNPDNDSYTIWYKRLQLGEPPESLVAAPEVRLDLSFTARPVGFDQRDVSAVVFQGNLYVFASAGFGGSQQPIYYYVWNGTTWTGPTALLTGGGGHANATTDGSRVYFVLEKGIPDTMQVVAYTWDGTIFNGPYVVAEDNGVPKLTLKDGTLYVVSVAPGGNTVNLHTAPASATPSTWTYITDPINIADAGVYVWDPSICHDGTTLYVLAAPSIASPDMQWIVQARSTDNGVTWTTPRKVSAGTPGDYTTYWWDFWPVGWCDQPGHITIFFATEGYQGVYTDGAIQGVGIDWNLNNDHGFYIQQAINVSATGDTVLVHAGSYRGLGNRDLWYGSKGIVVKSADGPSHTIIHCTDITGGVHQGFRLYSGETFRAVIDGFSIDSAFGYAAVACSSSAPVIKDCIISDNFSHGVSIDNASNPTLLGCVIRNNGGCGVMVKSTNPQLPAVTIRNCRISGNSSDGILIDHASAVVESTDVIANQGNGLQADCFSINLIASDILAQGNTGYGIVVRLWGGFFSLKNCTAVGNYTGIGYDFELPKGTSGPTAPQLDSNYIVNCLTAFNRYRGFASLFADPWYLAANCNDAYGNPGGDYSDGFSAGDGDGNISQNPLFCDTAAHDYRLYDNSPCLPANNSCHTQIGKFGLGCMQSFLCGDANHDGTVDISDAVYLIAYIFSGGPGPDPWQAADVNCDLAVDISDVVYLIAYIFSGGSAPCADCPIAPSGKLLSMGQCKTFPDRGSDAMRSDSQRCVRWQYDGNGTLLLTHENAFFNCCPVFEAQISIDEQTITITEIEVEGHCYCLCYYDLDYQIIGLPAGEFTVLINEPYLSPPIQFTTDLTTTPIGEYCQ